MNERSFLNTYAEAMELRVEGNRIIAAALAKQIRAAWNAVGRWFQQATRGYVATHRLPPI